jgi:hypothetical protein
MARVPQELIEAIVNGIVDANSLKSCALAASCFLPTSQRILLRSLALDGCDFRNFRALDTILAESPHVAEYATKLAIQFSMTEGFREPEVLRQIFRKLVNVREFTLRGQWNLCFWEDLTEAGPPVLEFIQHQKLTELHVIALGGLPLPVLAVFLSSVPLLSFHRVTALPIPGPAIQLPATYPLRQLRLSHSQPLLDVLARPELALYTSNLRRVAFRLQTEDNNILIANAARTLELIRFECLGMIFFLIH